MKMKKFFVLAAVSAFSVAASAQTNDPKHMINFDVGSVLQGSLNFDSSKARGQSSDNDTQLQLDLNYAYQLPMLKNVQAGIRFDYTKDTASGRGDYEDYGADIGAYWNFQRSGQELDLRNSFYASLFVGYGWANTYTAGTNDDEVFRTTAAFGKRIDLSDWGMGSLSYTPEVAFQSINSKTGGALEYTQNVQLRFLQFSVLF
ncbi:MAG: outer membrane beta-barrel protein [Bacteriovoracia bacterium]